MDLIILEVLKLVKHVGKISFTPQFLARKDK